MRGMISNIRGLTRDLVSLQIRLGILTLISNKTHQKHPLKVHTNPINDSPVLSALVAKNLGTLNANVPSGRKIDLRHQDRHLSRIELYH